MPSFRDMLCLVSLLLLAMPSFPRTHGAVHHINHPSHSIQQAETRGQVGNATTIPLSTNNWIWSLMGDVSLGSPARVFHLQFDLTILNLYVIDVNAQYYNSLSKRNVSEVTDKQTYDFTASSSGVPVHATYSPSWQYMVGSVASDLLQVGDTLQANVTFEDAGQVDETMQFQPNEGVFGLSSTPGKNTNTTLLGQLQSSLDSPVFTFNMVYDSKSQSGTGQLVLGGLISDTCQADWLPVGNTSGNNDYGLPYFQITGATVGGNSSGSVNIPITVHTRPYLSSRNTSYHMIQLLVQASNATYNMATRKYELTADQLAAARPVNLILASGDTLQLDPTDYTYVSDNGVIYLNVYEYSHDAQQQDSQYFELGLGFLNSHCLSKNFQTGVWSVARRSST